MYAIEQRRNCWVTSEKLEFKSTTPGRRRDQSSFVGYDNVAVEFVRYLGKPRSAQSLLRLPAAQLIHEANLRAVAEPSTAERQKYINHFGRNSPLLTPGNCVLGKHLLVPFCIRGYCGTKDKLWGCQNLSSAGGVGPYGT